MPSEPRHPREVLTTHPHDLRERAEEPGQWSTPVGGAGPRAGSGPGGPGAAPRLGPRQYIADGITRRGRFADLDPLRTARLPSRWEWAALAGWVGVAAWRGWRLWRATRGR